MQKYDFEVIGTHLFLMLDTHESMADVFSDIKIRLEDFEAKFSRFLTGNWLHTLNLSRRAVLDSDAKNMLTMMLDVAGKTDGYFDPTVGRRLTELGYGNQSLDIVNGVGGVGYGDYRDIEIAGDEVILHGDISLEFGGVGKGYLIDIIRDMIESRLSGEVRYMINFGGDLFARGFWKVGLESPFALDEIIGTLVLDRIALACSAGTRRRWGAHHHLIDPHSGESAREVVASYIESATASTADMYATALCVMPWESACDTLEKTPDISGVILRHDGVLYQKEGSLAEVFR